MTKREAHYRVGQRVVTRHLPQYLTVKEKTVEASAYRRYDDFCRVCNRVGTITCAHYDEYCLDSLLLEEPFKYTVRLDDPVMELSLTSEHLLHREVPLSQPPMRCISKEETRRLIEAYIEASEKRRAQERKETARRAAERDSYHAPGSYSSSYACQHNYREPRGGGDSAYCVKCGHTVPLIGGQT